MALPNLIVEKVSFSAEDDCCSISKNGIQRLHLTFLTGGGGYYAVLNTKRFALESVDIVNLSNFVTEIVTHNDNVESSIMENLSIKEK